MPKALPSLDPQAQPIEKPLTHSSFALSTYSVLELLQVVIQSNVVVHPPPALQIVITALRVIRKQLPILRLQPLEGQVHNTTALPLIFSHKLSGDQ
jgi:hypothetical protein